MRRNCASSEFIDDVAAADHAITSDFPGSAANPTPYRLDKNNQHANMTTP